MPPARKAVAKADPALLKAAAAGDLKGVQSRIAAGVDVNAADKREAPAIFSAVLSGKLPVVQALLDAGAKVNCIAYPSSGASVKSTPLCAAIDKGLWEMSVFLVKAGADLGQQPWSDHNAAGEAVSKAVEANYALVAPEEDWYGRRRTKALLDEAKVNCERWMQLVREAIAKGVKVRSYSLWEATNSRHTEMGLLLISSGADPNAAPHGTSVLVRALEHGNDTLAMALIKAGADVRRPQRETPLLVAAQKGRNALVLALLDAGAEINVAGDIEIGKRGGPEVTEFAEPEIAEEATALIIATRLGNLELVKLLVERGADVNIGDKHGLSALAWATQLGKTEIASYLKRKGAAEPEFQEGSVSSALWTAAKKGDAKRVEELLQRGAKPDEPVEDREGKHFALVSAAEAGQAAVVQALLRHKANVNAGASENWSADITPLMMAAREGHVEIIKWLVAAGANLEAKDAGFEDGGETALHYAARGGHVEAIKLLAAAGAKINAKAKGGRTPLLVAVGKKKAEAVKALLALGADANAGPSDGSGPLYAAAMENDMGTVKMLMAHGATLVPRGKKQDFAALGEAATKGHLEMVRLFLEAGAPINGQDVLGHTALTGAALYGREKIIEFLLARGADPNIGSRDNFTALMGAIRNGSLEVIQMLLKAGANVHAANTDGKTVLAIAKEGKKAKIISLIEDAVKSAPPAKTESKPAKAAAKKPKREEEDEEMEPPDFSEAAAKPEFQAALKEVEQLCGSKAKPLGDIQGGHSFGAATAEAEKLLADHHQRLLERGAYFFRHNRGYSSDQDGLGLLPTKDWADVIYAFQTNGANYDLMPGDIVKWMQKLAAKQPLIITGVSFDTLEGKFTTPVKDARKLAHQMYEFCPDIVDQGTETVKKLAQEIEKQQAFFFWWD